MDRFVQAVGSEGGQLVVAARGDLGAPVRCYDGWTVAELVGHTGRIHRWVTGVVADAVTERPAMAELPDLDGDALVAWLEQGVSRLVEVLAATDPATPVWTISRHAGTVGFWRRRMALETALHRWDAQDAQGLDAEVAPWLAAEGVDELLRLYLAERLDGREVGGTGQRLGVVPTDADRDGWTLVVRPDGVAVEDGVTAVDATVAGTALVLWRLLSRRGGRDLVATSGDVEVVDLAVEVAGMVPGPAG